MIIDTHLHPTNLVDEAWRHTGTPFNGERMLKLMDGPYMINGKPRRIDIHKGRTLCSSGWTGRRCPFAEPIFCHRNLRKSQDQVNKPRFGFLRDVLNLTLKLCFAQLGINL